jgi:hypothetical protein
MQKSLLSTTLSVRPKGRRILLGYHRGGKNVNLRSEVFGEAVMKEGDQNIENPPSKKPCSMRGQGRGSDILAPAERLQTSARSAYRSGRRQHRILWTNSAFVILAKD